MKLKLFLLFIVLVFAQISFADDDYKPYLHKASVPEHPEVRLFGKYSTNLFPGSATYSYDIEVPKGINNLQPNIQLLYNSHSVKQRPSVLGAGWFLNPNYVYRDVNSTVDDVSDDEFLLVLEGTPYELVYNPSDENWHTEVEYHFKIQNFTDYWLVTAKNGVRYRFGYNNDSRLESNTGKNYSLKWSLDEVADTYGNKIYYSYLEDPNAEDVGSSYLSQISYSQNLIRFDYEMDVRPDRRRVCNQGNLLEESRRLKDISVYSDEDLIRRYSFGYADLNLALSALSSISYFGNDNISVLYNISFDYYISNSGYAQNSTLWKPPSSFSGSDYNDQGARMIDLNNDGFIDIIQYISQGTDKAWLNDKKDGWIVANQWKSPLAIVNSAGEDVGVRFVDVNNDGFPDLLKSKSGTGKVFYLNTGLGWNQTSLSIPVYFVDSYNHDLGVRLADVDADGKVDIIKAIDSTRNVYINNGNGWTYDSSWSFPGDFVNSNNVDLGLRLVELNGDGWIDVLKGSGTTKIAWINNGSGWTENDSWKPPDVFRDSGEPDTGVRFADLNGDGLTDILKNNNKAWLNNGQGWTRDDSWKSPEPFTNDGYNIGRRLADLNGDGFADIIVSRNTVKNAWLKNSTLPYMLKSITNEYGGITIINYTKSTQFNNTVNGRSEIGFNLFVVSNVTINNSVDSFNVFSSTNYNYSLGKYNYDKTEFRGFGKATEFNPFNVINHYFYQDNPRRGKEYKTEVYDLEGNIYSRNINNYNWTIANGIYNLSLKYSTNYLFDGEDENPIISNKSYDYDFYENLLSVYDEGDINIDGDERSINYSYAYHTGNWMMDRTASKIVYDYKGDKVSQIYYYYDDLGLKGMGDKGSLYKTERWNNLGNNSFTYYNYDGFGNVISKTDSLGNTIKYDYDESHTYLDSIVNALGHISYFNYDKGTGNLLWEEKNGIRHEFEYDVFGRVIKEILPYDTSMSPTKSYSYNFDGSAPEKVSIKLKTTADKTNDIEYYYDGFANLVQLKTNVGDDNIVKNIFYDDSFRVSSEQNPYFSIEGELANISNIANYTHYAYDALDRVIQVVNPDGTNKSVVFDHYNITDFDENGNKHMYSLDSRGRIAKVYEYNVNDVGIQETYETTYDYDDNDNLIKITDSLGNEFEFTYDSLGRKIGMNDPDLGEWNYEYDNNGNLLKQTDARGKIITLTYDALNRIVSKTSDDINLTFNYDKDYYGTLTNLSMNDIIFSYEYDNRLRINKEIKTIFSEDFETSYLYDSQDRIISVDGIGGDIDFVFNKFGVVEKIPGFIEDSSYNAFGGMMNRSYTNSLTTSFTYNSENGRLTDIVIPNIQNLSYTYDDVGNVLSIIDSIQSRNHILSYDNLNRLIEATVDDDIYKYSFGPTGNMMKIIKNNETKKFVYKGSQAHAPSTVIEGSLGVDVYNPKELESVGKSRVFEFFLYNERESNSNANLSVDFGDGNIINNDSLLVQDNMWMFVQNDYQHGGNYDVDISVFSDTTGDTEDVSIKFGTRVNSLRVIDSNMTSKTFQLDIQNDIEDIVHNVTWECNGISKNSTFDLDGNQRFLDNFSIDFDSPGNKTLNCVVNSSDRSESQSIEFNIKGMEIESYDVLALDDNKRIVSYNVNNYFTPASVLISMSNGNDNFSESLNLDNSENVMVFAEADSVDGLNHFKVNLLSNNYSLDYIETFKIESVSIENYEKNTSDPLVDVLSFDIVKKAHDGVVNWSVSNPLTSNVTELDNGENISVEIQQNKTIQGINKLEIAAMTYGFADNIKELFEVNPLELQTFTTLCENETVVSELFIRNNLGSTQQFNLHLNTGEENMTSSALNITSEDDIFVFIASNYSGNGVFKTLAIINSSSYDDMMDGVVVK